MNTTAKIQARLLQEILRRGPEATAAAASTAVAATGHSKAVVVTAAIAAPLVAAVVTVVGGTENPTAVNTPRNLRSSPSSTPSTLSVVNSGNSGNVVSATMSSAMTTALENNFRFRFSGEATASGVSSASTSTGAKVSMNAAVVNAAVVGGSTSGSGVGNLSPLAVVTASTSSILSPVAAAATASFLPSSPLSGSVPSTGVISSTAEDSTSVSGALSSEASVAIAGKDAADAMEIEDVAQVATVVQSTAAESVVSTPEVPNDSIANASVAEVAPQTPLMATTSTATEEVVRPKRRVSFASVVRTVWVPTRQEYIDARLMEAVWYTRQQLRQFSVDGRREMQVALADRLLAEGYTLPLTSRDEVVMSKVRVWAAEVKAVLFQAEETIELTVQGTQFNATSLGLAAANAAAAVKAAVSLTSAAVMESATESVTSTAQAVLQMAGYDDEMDIEGPAYMAQPCC